MDVKQISVFLENKPGTLNEMTKVLTEHEIDLRALSLAETTDFGIARFITADVLETISILKDAGYVSSLTPVVVAEIPDEAGALNRVLQIFMEYKAFECAVAKCAQFILRCAAGKLSHAVAGTENVSVIRSKSEETAWDVNRYRIQVGQCRGLFHMTSFFHAYTVLRGISTAEHVQRLLLRYRNDIICNGVEEHSPAKPPLAV